MSRRDGLCSKKPEFRTGRPKSPDFTPERPVLGRFRRHLAVSRPSVPSDGDCCPGAAGDLAETRGRSRLRAPGVAQRGFSDPSLVQTGLW